VKLDFIVEEKGQSQGSMKGFHRAGVVKLTSDNPSLKAFRLNVGWSALRKMQELTPNRPMFGHHVPVRVMATFVFVRPPTAPKKRTEHVVKPDVDKLLRAVFDSLSGVAISDDAQIVQVFAKKEYGPEAYVRIVIEAV
jgi:Holliday junction resolvase RusA-like endonuclease